MSRVPGEFAVEPASGWSASSARDRYLSAASAALLSSLDETTLLEALESALVPGLVDLCQVERIAESHAQRSGPVPADSERATRKAGAAAVAPLRAGERLLGTLTLRAADPARLAELDAEWLEELGRRVGSALANADEYRAACEARQRADLANHAKDEFLATACHELRTPLGAIQAWLALVQREPPDEKMRKALEVVARNARAQQKLIEDVLDMSRIASGQLRLEMAPVDLAAVARHALDSVASAAEARSVELRLETRRVPPVRGDDDRLEQVLVNLLSNAIKFSNPGGDVRVVIQETANSAQLSVTDYGRGIDADVLPHLFQRVAAADGGRSRRVDGLGIGLSLVRHLVELHGGSVSADSPGPGRGATLIVSLPLAAPARA